jgi:RsiW-degrading membrane proteinase PrsW (M82 family)
MSEEKLITYLIERVEKIDDKVDRLLQFKWQIIGGSVVMSAILAVIIQIAAIVLK